MFGDVDQTSSQEVSRRLRGKSRGTFQRQSVESTQADAGVRTPLFIRDHARGSATSGQSAARFEEPVPYAESSAQAAARNLRQVMPATTKNETHSTPSFMPLYSPPGDIAAAREGWWTWILRAYSGDRVAARTKVINNVKTLRVHLSLDSPFGSQADCIQLRRWSDVA
ncbi:hypothetical protein M231_05678 [Tremella mesenterica]|uniref:Uncharacterized protein n=1 Tax=Tremella mesenterica TaxID=5217 RepID=A0A4Q1BHM1_TREME|nr:hypothetical protein M231_05678 [Tremella mesenterica]